MGKQIIHLINTGNEGLAFELTVGRMGFIDAMRFFIVAKACSTRWWLPYRVVFFRKQCEIKVETHLFNETVTVLFENAKTSFTISKQGFGDPSGDFIKWWNTNYFENKDFKFF